MTLSPDRTVMATAAPGPDRTPSRDVSHLWFFLVAASAYPLSALVRRVVDRSRAVTDSTGAVRVVSDGRVGELVQLGLTGVVLVLAIHVILGAHSRRVLRISPWAVVAITACVAELLRPDRDSIQVAVLGVTAVVLVAGGVSVLTPRVMMAIAHLTVLVAASLLVFALLVPDQGWGPCRPDKCSPVGALLVGYFPQENVVGIFLATLLPALAYLRRTWWRRASLVFILASLVMTGSRTALAATVLALVAYALIRRRALPSRRTHGDAAKILGFVPLGGFLLSLALLFLVTDEGLTGRGFVFGIVRRAWEEAPVLGPGRGILQDAYESSASIWLAAHEHSQAAYILAEAGVVGLVVTLAALLSVVVACWRSGSAIPAAFALVPALAFLTEPVWEFSLQALCFVSLLLTAALEGQVSRGEALPRAETPSQV